MAAVRLKIMTLVLKSAYKDVAIERHKTKDFVSDIFAIFPGCKFESRKKLPEKKLAVK